jgi:tetratricopeptide (TPR) repeat protein
MKRIQPAECPTRVIYGFWRLSFWSKNGVSAIMRKNYRSTTGKPVKNDCHYHPGEPSKWHCGTCLLHFCASCMPDADARRQQGFCPRCGDSMRYLGAATEVVPFWNRLPAFFRYPFHVDPLMVVAICTLVPILLSANLVGLIVSLILVLALFKYTYAVIRHTADGHMKPPPLAMAFTGDGFAIVLLQMVVFFLMGGLVFSAALVGGPFLAMLALAFVVLVMPASIMVLAMEHSVGAAVNPMNLMVLISRIGWPYFLLYGYIILLTIASGAAQEFAVNHFAPGLAQPLAGFLNSTFTLILFHMLGYLLFQYQEELGFASDLQEDTDEADQGPARDRSRRVDADIDMNLKDGNYDRVTGMLKELLKRHPHDEIRLGQFYRLTSAGNDAAEQYQHRSRLLSWLAADNNAKGIIDVLARLEAADPGFRLDNPELAVACASTLYRQGEHKAVLRLLQDFHKRFPASEHLAPAYLLVAQTLANGLGQWEKAIAFLKYVEKKCQNHPLHERAAVHLAQADRREPLKEPRASFLPAD